MLLCAGGAAVHVGIYRFASVLSLMGILWRPIHKQSTEFEISSKSAISQDTNSSTLSGLSNPFFIFKYFIYVLNNMFIYIYI